MKIIYSTIITSKINLETLNSIHLKLNLTFNSFSFIFFRELFRFNFIESMLKYDLNWAGMEKSDLEFMSHVFCDLTKSDLLHSLSPHLSHLKSPKSIPTHHSKLSFSKHKSSKIFNHLHQFNPNPNLRTTAFHRFLEKNHTLLTRYCSACQMDEQYNSRCQ